MTHDEDIILRPGTGHRDRRHVKRQRRSFLAVLVSLLILALIGGALVVGGQKVLKSFVGGPEDFTSVTGGKEVVIEVKAGDGATRIGHRLEEKGVVKSAGAFAEAADKNPDSKKIQPGFYKLRERMKASAALELLLDPKSRLLGRVTIAEGLTVKQILAKLSKETKIPLKKFQAAVDKPAKLGLPSYAEGEVEGFLFPATYDFEPNATADSVLKRMVDRFKEEAEAVDLVRVARELDVTPREAIVIASLIEEEARVAAERPKVSRVIYNRLKKGMRLQIDATIQYALGTSKKLTHADLKVDSPYNTYENVGLPPGPIASPGSASLKAALAPAKGPWLYYVVIDPKKGTHGFTDDYDEFINMKNKAKKANGG